jgi:hypothetical protein
MFAGIFTAAALGLKETLPPFLDPTLTSQDIKTGVSFASGGSGYDNLTAEFTVCSNYHPHDLFC